MRTEATDKDLCLWQTSITNEQSRPLGSSLAWPLLTSYTRKGLVYYQILLLTMNDCNINKPQPTSLMSLTTWIGTGRTMFLRSPQIRFISKLNVFSWIMQFSPPPSVSICPPLSRTPRSMMAKTESDWFLSYLDGKWTTIGCVIEFGDACSTSLSKRSL